MLTHPTLEQLRALRLEGMARALQEQHAHPAIEARTFDYGIYDGRSNEFYGCIGAHTIRWEHDCCEIGFSLGEKFQGHGFVCEALLGIEDELFRTGFHRIEIRCDRRNKRSASVAERSAYTLEATLKENLFERGEYRDTMIWGKVYAG